MRWRIFWSWRECKAGFVVSLSGRGIRSLFFFLPSLSSPGSLPTWWMVLRRRERRAGHCWLYRALRRSRTTASNGGVQRMHRILPTSSDEEWKRRKKDPLMLFRDACPVILYLRGGSLWIYDLGRRRRWYFGTSDHGFCGFLAFLRGSCQTFYSNKGKN